MINMSDSVNSKLAFLQELRLPQFHVKIKKSSYQLIWGIISFQLFVIGKLDVNNPLSYHNWIQFTGNDHLLGDFLVFHFKKSLILSLLKISY